MESKGNFFYLNCFSKNYQQPLEEMNMQIQLKKFPNFLHEILKFSFIWILRLEKFAFRVRQKDLKNFWTILQNTIMESWESFIKETWKKYLPLIAHLFLQSFFFLSTTVNPVAVIIDKCKKLTEFIYTCEDARYSIPRGFYIPQFLL